MPTSRWSALLMVPLLVGSLGGCGGARVGEIHSAITSGPCACNPVQQQVTNGVTGQLMTVTMCVLTVVVPTANGVTTVILTNSQALDDPNDAQCQLTCAELLSYYRPGLCSPPDVGDSGGRGAVLAPGSFPLPNFP
jgi:hypothetical protein